jgi:predicted ribosome quality control (RQC) complex YloA/Tae2 family protein
MDTFVLNAIAQELHQQIGLARINAIGQPDEHSINLVLWYQGHQKTLSISVAPQHQYMFLTSDPVQDQGPVRGNFFQHHLKGGEIDTVTSPVLERIVIFDIIKKGIDAQPIAFQLVLELMGRHSNLILMHQHNRKILESLRHITAAQSSYRRIVPGAYYIPPPQQKKINPITLDRELFQQLLQSYKEHSVRSEKHLPFWKFFLQQVQGFSPLLAKEVAGSEHDADARWFRFSQIMEHVKTNVYQPQLVFAKDDGACQVPIGVSAVPLHQLPCLPVQSMNQAAERYYRKRILHQQIQALKNTLVSSLRARLTKLHKKRDRLREHTTQIEQAEKYQRYGEFITANIYQLKKGMRSAEVIDYYSEGQPHISVALDPKLSPAQNAQRYFKRYTKLKHGKSVTQKRLQDVDHIIAHLEEWIFFIETANSFQQLLTFRKDLEELKILNQSQSDLPQKHPAFSKKSDTQKPFLRMVSSDGFDIYVGKSSKENDLLTQRTAQPEDIWLHVHQAPGSHVLILHRHNLQQPVPDQTLLEAAALAAYYSKFRQASKVDVMYTPRKYVKKPKGAPPGLVTVSQYRTIRVTPRADLTTHQDDA